MIGRLHGPRSQSIFTHLDACVYRDDKDPNKINIKKIISDESILRCSVDMEGDKIAGEIESTYGKFASGDIAKGIGSVLSIGLKALFGNAGGNSNSTQK